MKLRLALALYALASPAFAQLPTPNLGCGYKVNGTTVGCPAAVGVGGTGGATPAAARSALGAAASGANTDILSLGGLTTPLSVGQGGTSGSTPAAARASLGVASAGTKGTGTSVADPGTGNLEALLPVQTVTGASKTFAAADLYQETRRSNSGSAMTDTFPGSATTGLANGTTIQLNNVDTTASLTLSAGAGTTLNGNASVTIPPSRSTKWVYDAPSTVWRTTMNSLSGVNGPSSATSGNIATFNGATGSVIQDSGKTPPAGAIVGTTDAQTLTNKTLTSPSISTPTGIIKGDVGLGNVDNTSDATKNAATATLTNKTINGANNTLNVRLGSDVSGQTPIGNGGTGQATPAAARGSSGLNVESGTGHGDSAYTILATDRWLFTNAAFTASRTWTLPAASAVNAGAMLIVDDAQGTVTATNTLVVSRAGSDTINGGTSFTIDTANARLILFSDGVSKWTARLQRPYGTAAGNAVNIDSAAKLPAVDATQTTGVAKTANNLSDLANAGTARTNLGLGTAATVNTGTSGATIPLNNGNNTLSGNNTFQGAVASSVTPSSAWSMDCTGTTTGSVAGSGGTYTFQAGAGLITIQGVTASGAGAVFLISGALSGLIFQNGTSWANTVSGGKYSLTVSGTAAVLTNSTGGPETFQICGQRIRSVAN